LNNLKIALEEKDVLTKKLDALIIEFEAANVSISTLEQAHDGAVFAGSDKDATLTALTTSNLHRDSLSRVIRNIQENMIPIADQRIEIEEEAAREDIRAARQTLYDKCAGDIQKKMNDILKLIQTFDLECKKIEEEAGITISQNLPVFYVQESDRVQYI
jgi:glutamate mutase epsilon subunit